MLILPQRLQWSHIMSLGDGGRLNPIPEIITHFDEEVNEIDLNVLSGDMHFTCKAEKSVEQNCLFYC